MNPLERLKEKLKVKPNIEERQKVAVIIKGEKRPKKRAKRDIDVDVPIIEIEVGEEKAEPDSSLIEVEIDEETHEEHMKKNKMTIVDKTDSGFDRESLMKKLMENKQHKVTVKPILEKIEEVEEPVSVAPTIVEPKKPKKLTKMKKIIIDDEEKEEKEEVEKPSKKIQIVEDDEEEIIVVPKKKERKTKKVEKGVAIIGPETLVEIGDTPIVKRLPTKSPPVNIRVSSYYMNNREIFINFINSLFEPYRRELQENEENISCDTIGKTSSNFSLLTHQKIVRDYLNLYTPYRGLLLYHGLGSGKTCTSIAIAEGMKDAKKIVVMTPASLRRNYLEELKKCGDLLYKKNQYWEWISTENNDDVVKTLSVILSLPVEYIRRHRGAWLVNIKKKSNYDDLSSNDKKTLDEQLDEMIRNKYTFINYNGLRTSRLEEMTNGFTKNIFDNKVVIIDEAHNLISRIVNKLKREKTHSDLGTDIKQISLKIKDYSRNKENYFWEWVDISNNSENIDLLASELNLTSEYIRRNKGVWNVVPKKETNYNTLNTDDKRSLNEQLEVMMREEGDAIPVNLATKLYEYLLSAKNARIILLTGTPVINYPNEFGILFNILRGYIKTWYIQLDIKTSKKIDKNSLSEMLLGEKSLDYLDYSPSSKILTITRNPFGFKNKIKKETGYQGVSNTKKNEKNEIVFDTEFVSDDDFERRIIGILKRNDIEVIPQGIKVRNKKALPDTFDYFENQYIDSVTKKIKNIDSLKRRIVGLSSYFKSAQESLLPRFNKQLGVDYHVVKIPMSDTQFKIYETARREERKMEKKPKKQGVKDIYEDSSSTYRIFSRLFCNFIMPDRPVPQRKKKDSEQSTFEDILKDAKKTEDKKDINTEQEAEVEGDEILNELGGTDYKERLDGAIRFIEEHSNDFLTPEALQTYSPKFLNILENIKDPDYSGLHLVYSQFRTAEGIGLFSLVLEKNGFTRFKIKKDIADNWKMDIAEEDLGKPTYALYTGTESAEEKEIIRNIYNGDWEYIPTNIANELKKIANNNNMGEIVKVLMITSSGSEGINLRNTRYVHIMEPYWHPVRLEQVIGRARRICSHKSLPLALQTVEVFVYLMVFSEEQIKSDDAIELKRHDLSKGLPKVPITSDQYLYEISEIKANLTKQLTDSIKESAFDCYIYSNGNCLNFGSPTNTKFSYVPDFSQQQSDVTVRANQQKIEWVGKPITISGVEYIYRRISTKLLNIYDKQSYLNALETPGIMPVQIGTLEVNERGEQVFKQIVT